MENAVWIFVLSITLLGHLSLSEAQGCGFYYDNGTYIGTTNLITSIKETLPSNTTFLKLKFIPDTANPICSTDSQYLEYKISKPNIEVSTKGTLNKDYDEGLTLDDSLFGSCYFFCSSSDVIPLVLAHQVEITSVNDLVPIFSEPKLDITIDETTPPGVDILSRSDKLLYAYDMDYSDDGKDAQIEFSVEDNRFVVLPSFKISYKSANDVERFHYIPRVGLAAPWNRKDGTSVTFNLLATDQGTPQNVKPVPISVQIEQVDMENPKFLKDYYTAIVDSSQQAGQVLSVEPEPIKAVDPDTSNSEEIEYEIVNNDSLDLDVIVKPSGEIDVILKTPVIPSQKKMAYVVIQASEKINSARFDRVVLAIELPLEIPTTTTATPETCPPCTTTTISCPPCTLPTVTCPTSSTCDCTTVPLTTCPESPTCECTTTPLSPETSASSQGTCPSCPTCSTPETSDTSPWSSTTEPISTTNQESITSGSCPVVTCPTCPTSPSCPSCTTCPTCAPCPVTPCPSSTVASCPPCAVSSSTSAVIDCTTEQSKTTTPSSAPKPVVTFEKDQYASEIIENSAAETPIVVVHAYSSDGNTNIKYSLKSEEDSRYFKIGETSGKVTLASSLQKGSYAFYVEASIPTGEKGETTVRVEAIQGYVIGEMHFASSHYKFHINEKSANGSSVGVIELRNPSDGVKPSIASVDPPNMAGYFYLETKLSGNVMSIEIFVKETFDRVNSGPRVVLGISASLKRVVELSTVADIRIDDVNETPLITTSKSLVIGYPERTYLDPVVSMPIFTFQASDPDEGENAVLSYHLDESSRKHFDIDANNGQLFAKGSDSLSATDESLTVTVKDLPGSSSFLQVKIRSLRNEEIHVITATGPETLSDEEISRSLSSVLGYEVFVLHKVKAERATRQTRIDNFDYTVSVYAVQQGNFVGRTKFENDLQANAGNISGWVVSETVEQPQTYKPDKLANSVEAYTIATAVLASILGLILLVAVGYLVYLYRKGNQMPWKRFRYSRKETVEVSGKGNDLGNTYVRASDSTDSQNGYSNPASITQESREYPKYTSNVPDVATGAVQSDRVLLSVIDAQGPYSPDRQKHEKSILKPSDKEEEVYCPPTPTPKKSILKDVQQEKDGDKVSERIGVSFDPTPEVIQVAPTLHAEHEDEKAGSSGDESEDGAIAIL